MAALSAYNHDPWMVHLTATKRVLRYLCSTKSLELHFSGPPTEDDCPLIGYSDADWANNVRNCHSVGSYVFFYWGLISWRSKKQSILATSTLELEYTALLEFSKEALWLCQLLHDITNIFSPLSTSLSEIARLYLWSLEEKTPAEYEELFKLSGPAPLTDYTSGKNYFVWAQLTHLEGRSVSSASITPIGTVTSVI